MTTSRITERDAPVKLGAVVAFKDIRPGYSFRVLKPERHQDFWGGTKLIENDGLYSKVGAMYAHDRKTGRDAIFAPKMPCRVISDMGRYYPGEDIAMLNRGKPELKEVSQHHV